MATASSEEPASVLKKFGLGPVVRALCDDVRDLYVSDSIPWVLGYSGGKDSTTTLELVWLALQGLPAEKRTKPVHVISTDTLVENPVVAAWVDLSLGRIKEQGLPLQAHRLTPEVSDTFWVNLIGRGYPAPRHKFRWCTERLKINPSNRFIRDVVRESGEAILVLGTRKAESSRRAASMALHERGRIRDRLSPNASLPNSLVYSPIEDWTNDDVWMFLMSVPNPWGHENKELLTMYQGASADGECPLVIDASTPSCGDSRFGCWVCTMVEKDKSMEAMIRNDEEKEWMMPLLEIRNELDLKDDRERRDFRRINGHVQLFHDRPIHGPYKKEWREQWLRRILEAQHQISKTGPKYVRDIKLISMPELHEIRRHWLVDKHEFDDSLPRIYEEIIGTPFPGTADDDAVLGTDDWQTLEQVCGEDKLHFQLVAELLDTERRYRSLVRRGGLFDALAACFKRSFFDDEEDAVTWARTRASLLGGVETEAEESEISQRNDLVQLRLPAAEIPSPE
jgi:DNA sulfur modification protein DndC